MKMFEGGLRVTRRMSRPLRQAPFILTRRSLTLTIAMLAGVTQEKRYKKNVFLQSKLFIVMLVVFIVCVVLAVVNNPLTATKKSVSKLDTNSKPVAIASHTPKPVSFSGASGAGEVERKNDSLCVINSFVMNGEPFAVFPNGKTKKVEGGG